MAQSIAVRFISVGDLSGAGPFPLASPARPERSSGRGGPCVSLREPFVETRLSAILSRGRVEPRFRALSPEDAVDHLLRPVLLAEGFSPQATDGALDGIRNREGAGSTSFGSVACRTPGSAGSAGSSRPSA